MHYISLREYAADMETEIDRRERNMQKVNPNALSRFGLLVERLGDSIGNMRLEKFEKMRKCIEENQKFLNKVLQDKLALKKHIGSGRSRAP